MTGRSGTFRSAGERPFGQQIGSNEETPQMTHALIIDDNMAVSRAMESRLTAFGFDSFDRTWTGRQALDAAARRRPDLIVVGDHLAGGSPLEVARAVATTSEAPILAVTANGFLCRQRLVADAVIDGPYPLGDLDAALAATGACACA